MNVLIIDDEAEIRDILMLFLEGTDAVLYEAVNPEEAHRILETEHIDLVITDMHGCGGSKICCETLLRGIRLVVCSGDPRVQGYFKEVLMKPFDKGDVIKLVK